MDFKKVLTQLNSILGSKQTLNEDKEKRVAEGQLDELVRISTNRNPVTGEYDPDRQWGVPAKGSPGAEKDRNGAAKAAKMARQDPNQRGLKLPDATHGTTTQNFTTLKTPGSAKVGVTKFTPWKDQGVAEGYYKDPDGDDESEEDKEDKKDNEKRRREEDKSKVKESTLAELIQKMDNIIGNKVPVSEECGSPFGATEDSDSGMTINTNIDTRTGKKTISITADGDSADELMQILKLSGVDGGATEQHVDSDPKSELDVDVVNIPLSQRDGGFKMGGDDEVEEEWDNAPQPQTQPVGTQLRQGTDLNREKPMTKHGYQQGDNPMAMREEAELAQLEADLMEELDSIKVTENNTVHKYNLDAANKPTEPNETAIARRKRLQAIKDRQDDVRREKGEDDPKDSKRFVPGNAYGGSHQNADDDDEESRQPSKKMR